MTKSWWPWISKNNVTMTYDLPLVVVSIMLIATGLVMVTSASTEIAFSQYDDVFYFCIRQLLYLSVSLVVVLTVLLVPMSWWESKGWLLFLCSLLMLSAVLLVGREINGSKRWVSLGIANFQPSELAKVFIIIYLAGYLVRRQEEVRQRWSGFLKPMCLLALVVFLLLLEPDFGAAVVLISAVVGMLFLAGVKLFYFILLIMACGGAVALMAFSQAYRLQRLTTYIDPWAHQFDSGYQLTQALIAFGRGEWFGVGLGNSIQKLFYLPEAHTDFVFAVLAEEFGLIGALFVVFMLVFVAWRALCIGVEAERENSLFSAYIAYGLGLLLGMQALINIGVNTGLLPTKGLTLPLLSYGGSSLLVSCMAVALLLRIDFETRRLRASVKTKSRSKRRE
ncbi:putative lipid II flippase FtsW [Zooshikella ganghwensis]|uniref:Probable peptidoglycan glycosyltransferase FtsW n=1 Tax=Zooshikella ganghwensis TaxID=202772 RepID=A0A4P9VPM7_9GAMM|nr:putative lipid II flippase FtsW [Zooshikella ganghwensis]RDH45423.1 putative lipid II flippase FtsW [Zooshikella ganghwensis]